MAKISRLLQCGMAVVLLTLAAPVAWCQLPTTRLDAISPAGGKAGSEFEVQVRGADLDDVQTIHFSHPGITATVKPAAEGEKKDAKKQSSEAALLVKIAGDVPAGLYEARVAGRFGMSNPRIFSVGTQDEVAESGKNNTVDAAMEVAVGQLVNGTVAGETIDYFKINAKAGQQITFDCRAQRIDSKMDATLALFDADGQEMMLVRDTAGLDPVLTAKIPADGNYTLAVYDFTYEGGADYFYRLSIHDGPRVDFVFPPVVEAGKPAKVTAYGQNLPGGQPAGAMAADEQMQQVAVDIAMPADEASRQQLDVATAMPPHSAAVDAKQVAVAPANKAIVAYATAPVVVEQEPNSAAAEAQAITVPCEYVGRFYPTGDRDWVRFDAKKGDIYWIEVVSHRMGAPSDPMLVVEQVTTGDQGEESGKQIAEVDDAGAGSAADALSTATKDPAYRFEAKEDGAYRVLVYDLHDNAGSASQSVYRLAIRRQQPDFRLLAYAPPAGDQTKVFVATTALRRGGSAAIDLKVIRRDGFAGEIDVTAADLPAGVSCPAVTIPAGESAARLVLVAEENAAPWAGTFTITGRAQVDGQELVREARCGSLVWGTDNAQLIAPIARLTSDLSLAVINDMVAPASVTLGSGDMVELKVGEKVDLPVSVARRGDFKGPLKLSVVGLPKEIKVADVNVTADTANVSIDLTNAKMKEGTYTVHLQGVAKVKYTRPGEDKPKDIDVPVLSTPLRIRVAAKG